MGISLTWKREEKFCKFFLSHILFYFYFLLFYFKLWSALGANFTRIMVVQNLKKHDFNIDFLTIVFIVNTVCDFGMPKKQEKLWHAFLKFGKKCVKSAKMLGF